MIQVNLLPMHLRPVRRTIVPHAIALIILAAGVAIIGMLFAVEQAKVFTLGGQVADVDRELAKLKDVIDRTNELLALKQGLQSKVETIEEITRDRIVWSRQLYNLGRLAPPNVWYSGIATDDKVFSQTKLVYDPKTKTSKPQTESITKPVLVLQGYVTPAEDGRVDVNPLMDNLAEDPEFSRIFVQGDFTFTDEFFENRFDVRKFELEYIIEPEAPDNE